MGSHLLLAASLEAGEFEPYIRHIRFPRFKNVDDGTRIEFTHPITALVGQNGTNKTSILRALQGCPDYNNFGNYWFSTNLDPINGDVRYRFIHGYMVPTGNLVESIKTRVQKKDNPDYFEPSRPLIGDQMSKMIDISKTPESDRKFRTDTRWRAIDKKVVYLDFRHDIPAYDIHSHFNIANAKNDPRSKKNLVRRRARHLAAALDGLESEHQLYNKNRILEAAVELSTEVANWVSRILGRKYTSIRLVKHTFYGFEGHTVRLESSGISYSEAFAGSGEYAVIMIVKSVLEAPPRALIILDEPEVSLHPAAQKALMGFLLEVATKKKHQIVISTHSPDIIRDLPSNAIKVLIRNAMSGGVSLLADSALPNEAFRQIGLDDKKFQIFVEDELAKYIVEWAIRPLGLGVTNAIEVRALGGADLILSKYVPSLVEFGTRGLVFLDGDKRPSIPLLDPDLTPDIHVLEQLAKIGINKKHLGLNGGNADNSGQAILKGRKVLSWAQENLRYLPEDDPEGLLLKMRHEPETIPSGTKEYWASRAASKFGYDGDDAVSSGEILSVQRLALAEVPHDSELLKWIRNVVESFVEGAQ